LTYEQKVTVNERKNELDYSPLFQSKATSVPKDDASTTHQAIDHKQPSLDNASMPESQNAGDLEVQHNITATEKVTYRFHPEGKYAIEDIKTILARKIGIKASFELIAEEAILIAYEDVLANQHASKLAKRLSRIPGNQKTS
jgi:hypothetical protein